MKKILIIDFGSQYTQLIARRVRGLNVYCEIVPHTIPLNDILTSNVGGIILSGGPASCTADFAPKLSFNMTELTNNFIPILGICYGMQLMAKEFNGVIEHTDREYGFAIISPQRSRLFENIRNITADCHVWMSHGDTVKQLPTGFKTIATTTTNECAAIENTKLKLYGVQFHPEVKHTSKGSIILDNFLNICGIPRSWTPECQIDQAINEINQRVGATDRILIGLSGGVDSSVVALLCKKAVDHRIIPIHVDTGLNRLGEAARVKKAFEGIGIYPEIIDASSEFFEALEGIIDPEEKRKIVGKLFIDIFNRTIQSNSQIKFLAQGTLYPDVVESISPHGGPTAKIKTHHNVGGIPDDFETKLIEPLKFMFKDEVRTLGYKLGLSEEFIERQPFPGPGYSVRIIGEITEKRAIELRKADQIVIEEISKANLKEEVWQAFAVDLGVKTVGIKGDERTYQDTCSIRIVASEDAMTASWIEIPSPVLRRMSTRITNECEYGRVLFDISDKPPSTIEYL